MLKFFRKYQKSFFFVIAFVTIFSFIFFGTYQAFSPSHQMVSDETAFRAIDGKEIKRSYLNDLCRFISQEPAAPIPSRRGMVGNFLNDGVLSKDFLEGELAYSLFKAYPNEIAQGLTEKLAREKKYTPYVHPHVKFISAGTVWGLFAPEINPSLERLQKCESANTEEAFQARVHLYLAERRFPPSLLAQVLRYQEKENPAIPSDPRLQREELSLFGYHSAQDWFGEPLIECTAQFILNAAAISKQKGYQVSDEEAKMDLLVKTEKTYQALKEIPSFPLQNPQELFHYYLKTFQFDEATLVKLWQDVLLFRKLFQDAGGVTCLDTHTMQKFYSHANEYATIELHQMPQEFRFQNAKDLQGFETYLVAVCPDRERLIDLPDHFESLEVIEKRAPEFIGRRYQLEIGSVTRKNLQAKVSLKETWEWEVEDKNWILLQNQFPKLAAKKADNCQTRERYLEELDKKTRMLVDEFAANQMIEAHPEWLEEALAHVELKEKDLFLKPTHTKPVLEGIKTIEDLKNRLDQASSPFTYTQDNQIFYKIHVKHRAQEQEIVTFKEAKKEGLLDVNPIDCASLVKSLYKDALEHGIAEVGIAEEKLADRMASYRFAAYLREHPEGFNLWKPIKKEETLTRSSHSFISFDKVIACEPGISSNVYADAKEGAYYFRFLDKKVDRTAPIEKLIQAQQILSIKAKVYFMDEVMKKIQEKQAISLKEVAL